MKVKLIKKGHTGLFSDTVHEIGSVALEMDGPILDKPTRTSIQIGTNKHIEDTFGGFVNHKCDPNVKIVNNKLIALEKIWPGDEITFNYNKSEDMVSNPFSCHCCGRQVRGRLVTNN